MTLLLIHFKYSRHMSHFIVLVHINVHVTDVSVCGLYSKIIACFGLVPDYCTFTVVGTWVFYIKCIICRLPEWVHCAGISCTIILSHSSFATLCFSWICFFSFLLSSISVGIFDLVHGSWNLHWNTNHLMGSRTGTWTHTFMCFLSIAV